ncbi:MAG: hypothetical protein R3B06_32210 [Kofleriaceae bacterium]
MAYAADRDAWQVTWRLGRPSSALRFDRRAAHGHRDEVWQAAAGLRWRRDGDADVLEPIDGVPRQVFAAALSTDDTSAGRAAPTHLRWSDGAVVLFTGAIAGDVEVCDATRCGPRAGPRSWAVRAPGAEVRIGRVVARDAVTSTEAAGARGGAFVRVGPARAPTVDDATVTLVLDRGLPAWLAAETQALVPRLLARFTAQTGQAPPPPVVLAGARPSSARGLIVRGRMVPGAVVLEAAGAGFRRASAGARRQWTELLAHELFHLWNGDLARRTDLRDEWLSEGGAAFVAGVALREAGLLDGRRYGWRVVAAANACAQTLRGPLADVAAEASYYACGELVHVVIDRALTGDGGVMPVVARLFADARARASGTYGTADLVALVAAAEVAPATLAAVRALLETGPGPQPLATVAQLLAAVGITTTVVPARRGRPPRLRFVRARPAW